MIAGFKIPDLDREKIKEGLYNKCNIEIDFYLLSALSAMIATLGLIRHNCEHDIVAQN